MKKLYHVMPYILISGCAMCIFFIALFVCCVSLEAAFPTLLSYISLFSSYAIEAQRTIIVTVSIVIALYVSGSFMNRALYKFGTLWGK